MAQAAQSEMPSEEAFPRPERARRRRSILQLVFSPWGLIGATAGLIIAIGLSIWMRSAFSSNFTSSNDLTYLVKSGDLTISFTESRCQGSTSVGEL